MSNRDGRQGFPRHARAIKVGVRLSRPSMGLGHPAGDHIGLSVWGFDRRPGPGKEWGSAPVLFYGVSDDDDGDRDCNYK